MSSGRNGGAPSLGLEKFMGSNKEGEYTMWKDKFLTYIKEQDQIYERGLLEKDESPASVLMVDFLDGHPEKPIIKIGEATSREELRCQHWTRANSAMLNLLNQSVTKTFLSALPNPVSSVRPCDIWKLLEQTYGVGDAGGIIELHRKWNRITSSNWSDLGTLFAQLKQLRNDMNQKMMGLIGKEMVMGHWLCMEVLVQLPSEFWGSSIGMMVEWFTIENVETSLRRVFGDRSKKEINMLSEKKRHVMINVSKRLTGKERSQVDSTSVEPGNCFYCFEDGHRKKDCPTMVKDRDPKIPGGALFRSNIRTALSAKKKRVMAVKKVATLKKKIANGSDMTTAEAHVYDQQLVKAFEDADEFAFDENVQVSEGEETEDKVFNPMDIDAKVRKRYARYLSMLKELDVTDDLWVVDTGAGHAVSPSRH
ncbi:unnamed protein product [Phytophthora fragariaefolia]|uniref:Unnamed protein product n=1 Tax=Phytophthora fragariaefolia TaxID=1490495 RepID=A0A9W6XPJ6_9STRA|nr:unnamed protein product [Phytophthora fragariaefolia]